MITIDKGVPMQEITKGIAARADIPTAVISMAVGDSILLGTHKERVQAFSAAQYISMRTGEAVKLRSRRQDDGYRVWRIA